MCNEKINTIEEDIRKNKLLNEMNDLYYGYKTCRDSGEEFKVNTCIGLVIFQKIPHINCGVSVYIEPKELNTSKKIKRLEEEITRLKMTLLYISGNDSTSSSETLGQIARDALHEKDIITK